MTSPRTSTRCDGSFRATAAWIGETPDGQLANRLARQGSRLARQPALRPPPGSERLPAFDRGWRRADGGADPYISFVGDDHSVNWSEELEQLHEESSREHFIDVFTRRSMLARMGPLPSRPVVVDL